MSAEEIKTLSKYLFVYSTNKNTRQGPRCCLKMPYWRLDHGRFCVLDFKTLGDIEQDRVCLCLLNDKNKTQFSISRNCVDLGYFHFTQFNLFLFAP